MSSSVGPEIEMLLDDLLKAHETKIKHWDGNGVMAARDAFYNVKYETVLELRWMLRKNGERRLRNDRQT